MIKPISLLDVKAALADGRFRETLPAELSDDVTKYLQNPGCACNLPIYRRILKKAKEQLLLYFPGRSIAEEKDDLPKGKWSVINCHYIELEAQLRKLPPGRKQIAVARYEDQVTVVVNELETP